MGLIYWQQLGKQFGLDCGQGITSYTYSGVIIDGLAPGGPT